MSWHARISASGMKRTIKCAGSIALVESMPQHLRRGSGAAARQGTAAHGLGEHCLTTGLDTSYGLLGGCVTLDEHEDATVWGPDQIPAEAPHTFPIDDDMCNAVDVYLRVAREIVATIADPDVLVERTFNLDWLRPDLGGTSDLTIWEFMGTLYVIDYKHGQGVVVEVDENEQMLTYALGMAEEVDWLFEDLVLIIVQPRAPHLEGGVRRWTTTKERLRQFQGEVAAAYDRTMEAGEELSGHLAKAKFGTIAAVPPEWAEKYLVAGDHCTFCDAAGPLCPAVRRRVQEAAGADFADVAEDDDCLARNLPTEEELANEEVAHRIAEVLDWVPAMDRFIKAAKELGFRHSLAGHKLPGHKLVEGRSLRKYVVPEATIVERIVAEKPDIDVERLYEPKKIKSPAQLEKLGPFAKRLVNGVAGEDGWAVEPLALKGKGTLSLVPDSNPKPAVTVDPNADFDGVEEDEE